MKIVGIDPGLDGGITLLESSNAFPTLIWSEVMPLIGGAKGKRLVDAQALKRLLLDARPDIVFVEKVGARPGQGVTSMFNFGYSSGLVEGVVAGLGFRVEFVTPQVWQNAAFQGIPKTSDKPSQIFCQRLFPSTDWRGSERCRTPHDGKTDSCGIAYYGIIRHTGFVQK